MSACSLFTIGTNKIDPNHFDVTREPFLSIAEVRAIIADLQRTVAQLDMYVRALSQAIHLDPVPPETTPPTYPPAVTE